MEFSLFLILKGVLYQKIDIFKELAPRSRTYELRGQGKKKEKYQITTNKHLTLSYKKLSPKMYNAPLTGGDRGSHSYFLGHKRATRTPWVKRWMDRSINRHV